MPGKSDAYVPANVLKEACARMLVCRQRRNFEDRRALAAARAVPFFGLAYYLLVRPPLPGEEEA